MAPLQPLVADARSKARACVATLAVWAMVLGPAGSPRAQEAVPEQPDVPGPAAEAAAGTEAEGEAPAPPKLVLGVPPKFPVTPAVEKAVHDIDEVMQWFMSMRAVQYLTPINAAPSVLRQRDRANRAFDTLAEEARRHPAMLEAARQMEGGDRHAKLMLMGLDRSEHLEEYEWVRDVLLFGIAPHPGILNQSRQIDGLAAREFFGEEQRRRYVAEYFSMGIFMPHPEVTPQWMGDVTGAFRDHPDPRSVILFAYLIECADTQYPAQWLRIEYQRWCNILSPPRIPGADNPFDSGGSLGRIDLPEDIAAIRDHINEHARPLRDRREYLVKDIPRYPREKFMEPEEEQEPQ